MNHYLNIFHHYSYHRFNQRYMIYKKNYKLTHNLKLKLCKQHTKEDYNFNILRYYQHTVHQYTLSINHRYHRFDKYLHIIKYKLQNLFGRYHIRYYYMSNTNLQKKLNNTHHYNYHKFNLLHKFYKEYYRLVHMQNHLQCKQRKQYYHNLSIPHYYQYTTHQYKININHLNHRFYKYFHMIKYKLQNLFSKQHIKYYRILNIILRQKLNNIHHYNYHKFSLPHKIYKENYRLVHMLYHWLYRWHTTNGRI